MKKKFALSVVIGALSGSILYIVGKNLKEKEKVTIHKQGIYEKWFKRPLDFCCALFAGIVFLPVILIIALLVRFRLGSPVIFKQERPGLNEKKFILYKFRTMTDKKDVNGDLLSDEERLTKFGKILRSTSLDELPELWNILKGDMSIVGPRPLATIYLDYYTEDEHKRHNVRPGLTGLAQVNGRNSLGWEEKFLYDLEYVSNISMKSDVSIVLKTVGKVLKRESIGQAEEAPQSLHIERGGKQENGGEVQL
ncbi:MAG: sugar transferase [Lachnospiraceae bacterium]|nr:sugar transferase [Lachnospiraceae bacterium]